MASVDLSGGGGAPGAGPGGAPPSGVGGQLVQAAMADPRVQQQAFSGVVRGAERAATELKGYIQEGPAGMSVLCFMGGLATALVGFLGLLSIGSSISTPFMYLLNLYLTGFGGIAVILEADVQRLHGMAVLGKLAPLIERYQFEVFENAKFLTELRGRGLFYVFIGTLATTQCLTCLTFLCGFWNLVMGVLCLMMSFGINPAIHVPLQQELEHPSHGGPPMGQGGVPLYGQGGQGGYGP